MEQSVSESVSKRRTRSSRMPGDVFGSREEAGRSRNGEATVDESDHDGYVKGDGWNIAILLFLYLLQGIPLGLSAAIPIILQNRKINYSDQAEFSFAFWPFSMKLLWAPIVDAVYSNRFGRRKSWLIPTQFLLGLFMLLISMNVDSWLGDETGEHPPNIRILTIMFFASNFLAATQDIAVDGWALTMLHRKNVGHASTCNSVGQTAGYFFGYVLFIALDSAEFCNRYLYWIRPEPEPTGLISFSTFMYFWAIVFLIATTLVALFKKDRSLDTGDGSGRGDDIDLNVGQSYRLLWEILKLKPVQYMAMILLTVKIGFVACDSVAPLKLVENGVPKEKLALIAVPLIPLQIILPFMISKYVVGPRPMDCYLAVIPYRLLIGLLVAGLVYVTPSFRDGKDFPLSYYGILLFVYGLHQMVSYCMFVASMAFFAKVSDPRSGGTYMTLLNTLANLGGTWPTTMVLWLVDVFTWKSCITQCKDGVLEPCERTEFCSTYVDGFFVEMILCTVIGIVWLVFGKRILSRLQNLGDSAWLVNSRMFPLSEEACGLVCDDIEGEWFIV